ncbi:hypothetical protein RU58_00038 [Achromobacter phage phiAxp-1]|uniref:Rz-like spanin n=1 Tax=Achromobacter phage phiAxp-1 TaxID=1610509 RepID=UPI0006552EB6|nr:Rz-like spanin [Achromobacter phage phiAxp-1]AKJ71363.1 hypothetical protein RU58_00038 [Achromobacter phage phiAxp-1]QDH84397.1 hypothetical protein Axy18_037 [Achromobacter phage vB_AxyS_19-32_Axy18]WNO48646.1 hypothetical protein [Achromobacter phage shaaii_LB5]
MDWITQIPGPVGILGALLAVVMFYVTGRRSGRADAEREHQRQKAEEATEQVRNINRTVGESNARSEANRRLDGAGIRDRMRNDYRR